ncbi:MAG: TonB-dependent receptor [Bacteroidales bacterium]|nr:TonB-dependent receptor [Bacteroidales bacterium]
MKKLFCIILLFWPFFGIQAQRQHTISGTVVSRSSGEPLICATVVDVRSGKGTVTNANGRFSLTLPADTVAFRVSYVGYQRFDSLFCLSGNMVMNVSLLSGVQLRAVTVNAERVSSAKSSQISAIEIPMEQIKAVPVLFGETDILKTLQLLPGVQNGTEGMNGVYVRGGGPDENLFLLDGVSLYNVNHLGGFFSAFNSSAVKNVTLYKGSFPARFGGRLSSVLDITTNNGNDKEIHGDISVGLIAAKLSVEGPIIKEKTTFSFSLRRTYGDLLVQPFLGLASALSEERIRAGYYFYDLNAKVTHKFNDRSRLYASYYMGDDVVYLKVRTRQLLSAMNNDDYWMKMGYNWGNIVGSLRWNYELTPKLFMNITGAYTRYRNNISMGAEEHDWSDEWDSYYSIDMSYKSGIRDLIVRSDFDYAPNPDHAIKFGGAFIHHIFTPEVMGMKMEDRMTQSGEDDYNDKIDTVLGQSRVHAEELFCFVEDDWSITSALKINMGVYVSGFSVENKFYPSLQPRLSGRLLLSDNLSLKAGYAYMTQYMHLLSNFSINLPTDLWVPVTARIEPMNAHQVAAGVFYNWSGIADLSMEAYYKSMDNLLEYKDGASFWSSSSNWEDKVCIGRGWSYGVEFLAQRTFGKYSGWVGYTWSRTMRLFDREGMEINEGKPFPAKYDRWHDISIVLMYKPSDRFDASVTWVYSTGNATTLAMQEFQDEEASEENDWYNNQVYGYVDGRNNFRMPAYHRMDVGVNFHKQKKRGLRTISLSVYNLYNRKNPFIVYESGRYHYNYQGVTYSSSLVQLSIFPFIPSISYKFEF